MKSLVFIPLVFSLSYAFSIQDTISTTLKNNSDILLKQKQKAYYKGLSLSQDGTFDTTLSSSLSAQNAKLLYNPAVVEDGVVDSDLYTLDVHVDKTFQSGISLETGLGYDKTTIDYDAANYNTSIDTAKVYFSISKPLLKNNNTEVITADKTLSEYDKTISEFSYYEQINKSIFNSIVSYWKYKLSYEKNLIYIQEKATTKKMLEDVKALIKADEKPKDDLLQIISHDTSKKILLLNAKLLIATDKNTLAVSTGLTHNSLKELSTLSDDFAKPNTQQIPKFQNLDSFYLKALENRMDIKIYKAKIKKSNLSKKVQLNDMKADLDLSLDADYALNSDNSFNSLYNEDTITLTLSYAIPIENSSAKGALMASISTLSQDITTLNELKRTVKLKLQKILTSLEIYTLNYQLVTDSIKNYEEALKNEKIKYSLGLSTVLSVTQTHDLLYQEKIKSLEVLYQYSNLLAQLYYETGMIEDKTQDNFSIDTKQYFTIN